MLRISSVCGGMNGVMMKTWLDKLRDKLVDVWEWVKVIALWVVIVGAIVLGWIIEHLVIVV